jgi:hypothetical protein
MATSARKPGTTTTRKPRRAATKSSAPKNGKLIYTFAEGNA